MPELWVSVMVDRIVTIDDSKGFIVELPDNTKVLLTGEPPVQEGSMFAVPLTMTSTWKVKGLIVHEPNVQI